MAGSNAGRPGPEAYHRFMGRWSRLVAGVFVPWLQVPAGRTWLDVGCGSGALAAAVAALAAPRRLVGVDPEADLLRHAGNLCRQVTGGFACGRGEELPIEGKSVDAVVSGLAINQFADPVAGVREMVRAVVAGGTVAGYVWDFARMEMLRRFWELAVELDPAAADLDPARKYDFHDEGDLFELFSVPGLCELETRCIDVTTTFADFGDFWQPFLSGRGRISGYVVGLPAAHREVLRKRVHSSLPIGGDGSISLPARALSVRGRRR